MNPQTSAESFFRRKLLDNPPKVSAGEIRRGFPPEISATQFAADVGCQRTAHSAQLAAQLTARSAWWMSGGGGMWWKSKWGVWWKSQHTVGGYAGHRKFFKKDRTAIFRRGAVPLV